MKRARTPDFGAELLPYPFLYEISVREILLKSITSLTNADMLSILSEQRCSRTELATKCSMDTRALTEFLIMMLKCKLAAQSGSHIEITNKGKSFLDEYEVLAEMLR